MRLKYRVVLSLLAISFAIGLTAITIGSGFTAGVLFIIAMLLFILSLSTMMFADKNDRKITDILADGFLASLIH